MTEQSRADQDQNLGQVVERSTAPMLVSATRMRLTNEVQAQIADGIQGPLEQAQNSPGFRGCNLWTSGGFSYFLTGWDSVQALTRYVRTGVHAEAMREVPLKGRIEVLRWTSDKLPDEHEVEEKFGESGRASYK